MKHINQEQAKTNLYTLSYTHCSACGLLFEKRTGDVNRAIRLGKPMYCSNSCERIGRSKKIVVKCCFCGKQIQRYDYDVKGHIYCTKECAELDGKYHLVGEKHPRWKGGGKYLRGAGWKKAKRETRKRDNYSCQICGMTEYELGKKMDVHHITPYRLFNNPDEANRLDNLICLCPSCHHREDARVKE